MIFYYAQERKRLRNSKNIEIRQIASESTFILAAEHLDATHIISDEHGGKFLWERNPKTTGNRPFDKPGWKSLGPTT